MSAGIELERPSPGTELKYKKLREEADAEYEKKKNCMQRAHEAYENGDGAGAKQLSNEGKEHAARAEELDRKASRMIFDINNAMADDDAIDLHGQYVEEAISRLAERIRKDQVKGRPHLHVIVGKGNHSVGHIQKLKPAVEDLCRDLGLHYKTEENAGRVFVDLQGGDISHIPPLPPQPAAQHAGYGDQPYGGYQQEQYPSQQQQQQQQQQQHYGGQSQEEQQYDDIEKLLAKLFKKYCCTVM
ncbi:hypothetical protein EKO27_g7084 [Xylaria grammica]|uniref:Smr domain-containing protein n=1 Tax=Xylaria grammica TaxID=363999 RepID=A0A439D0S6_9PEZI|nr:hypothetical protein EKO27_g7084 [Xylaria grammica]